jgi:hypothetical protein
MNKICNIIGVFLILLCLFWFLPTVIFSFNALALMLPHTPEFVTFLGRMSRAVPWHVLAVIAMFLIGTCTNFFTSARPDKTKPRYYVWGAANGIQGPLAWQDIEHLPGETLIQRIPTGANGLWTPLHLWQPYGQRHYSPRSKMACTTFWMVILSLHAWNNLGACPLFYFLWILTCACGALIFAFPASGSVRQKPPHNPKNLLLFLFGPPQPPDL